MKGKNIFINGNFLCQTQAEVLKSRIFRQLLFNFIREKSEKDPRLKKFFSLFKNRDDIINLLLLLTHHKYTEISETNFGVFCEYLKDRDLFYYFLEKLYHYWRSFNRFMIKKERYLSSMSKRLPKKFVFSHDAENLKLLVLETFRTIAFNGTGQHNYIFRQTTAGTEIGLLIDYCRFEKDSRLPFNIYDIPVVWTVVMEQPIIYYTMQNKRSGIIKITEKDYFSKHELGKKEFLMLPVWVGDLLIFVYVHKDFLHLGASLANLFEFADLSIVKKRKPDGIFVFGANAEFFNEDEQAGLVKIYTDLDIVAGFVPYSDNVDYFGYMKKSILTIHNIIQLHRKQMPVHGAMVRIILKDDKAINVMFIGDSGAGKSETISALLRLGEPVKDIKVIVDDMGTLKAENGQIKVYGTEIGAFIRLDDLETGFAFSELDRSIFMNPNKKNARVIIPFATYHEIIAGYPIDAFFYANNYEPVNENKPAIEIFRDINQALTIFREGKRMAKGTTSEKGITSSYFGNPFGAVQFKTLHQKIEEKIFSQLFDQNIPVGIIRTQLGLDGMQFKGPDIAARALLNFIVERAQKIN